jgi:hypothetical protein
MIIREIFFIQWKHFFTRQYQAVLCGVILICSPVLVSLKWSHYFSHFRACHLYKYIYFILCQYRSFHRIRYWIVYQRLTVESFIYLRGNQKLDLEASTETTFVFKVYIVCCWCSCMFNVLIIKPLCMEESKLYYLFEPIVFFYFRNKW